MGVAMAVRILALAAATVVACGPVIRRPPAWPDTPLELRDDRDRDQAIDELWVMPAGLPREQYRADIVDALARRIREAVQEERPFAAAALLDELTALWQHEPASAAAGLAPHVDVLTRVRAMFARAGALEPAAQSLILLAEADRADRASHLAELDELLSFADELAIADNGPTARRGQPIALLQDTALALPVRWLVDRYVALLSERQRVIATLIEREGASLQVVRAHHDVLSTSRRIANVLARAGRCDDIHAHVAKLSGLGVDREVATRAEIVAEHPSPDAYVKLARILRNDEGKEPSAQMTDATAALATLLTALRRHPDDPTLLAAAGDDARALGRIEQAIAFYERAVAADRDVDSTLALRLGRLYGDRIERLASHGRPSRARAAWRGVLAFTSRESRQHPNAAWQQAAAIAESALGEGLATQGLLADARDALVASIERAPSIEAFETLVAIELQTGRFVTAQRWASAGMAMLGEQGAGDRWHRARLERLVGDSMRRSGRAREAGAHYVEAMRAWASLGESKDLPRIVAAERSLDYGRILWWLGELGAQERSDRGVRVVESIIDALDRAPQSTEIATHGIAFLLEIGRTRDAIDAYHRALGADLPDATKISLSLWIAADAVGRGEPIERLASEFLASRQGDTWPERLARAASGRMSFAAVAEAATTAPRQAELAFYGAILGFHPEAATPAGRRRLLEQVIAAQLVLDPEHGLARQHLATQPPAR